MGGEEQGGVRCCSLYQGRQHSGEVVLRARLIQPGREFLEHIPGRDVCAGLSRLSRGLQSTLQKQPLHTAQLDVTAHGLLHERR